MEYRRILVTGGAGFIGSHVVDRVCQAFPNSDVWILDKMTYAADFGNISQVLAVPNHRLFVGDVCDLALCKRLTKDTDCVIHLAAESHVDNSFGNSMQFTLSNALGTHTLMEACRINHVPRIIHVSTDEVYGEILGDACREDAVLNPSNPYSASKASAEMLVRSYRHSFKLPVLMVRGNNIFGIRQFPEKIIPRFILKSLKGQKLTIHGTGKNSRHYLHTADFVNALVLLLEKGVEGEVYNVGSYDEFTNLEVARMICDHFGRPVEEFITFVPDRPFNDARYAVNFDKLSALGWQPGEHLPGWIAILADWYAANVHRYENNAELWA